MGKRPEGVVNDILFCIISLEVGFYLGELKE